MTAPKEKRVDEKKMVAELKEKYPEAIVKVCAHTVSRKWHSTSVTEDVLVRGEIIEEIELEHVHKSSGYVEPYQGTNFNQTRWIWVLTPDSVVEPFYRL